MLYALLNVFGCIGWILDKLVWCYFIVLAFIVACICVGLVGLAFAIIGWMFS